MASTSGGSNDRGTVASVALRFGRLRLSNAMGAADRTLALPATAQSWTGTAWDTNTLDSCSTVPATAVNFGNLRKTLTLADLSATAAITLASGVGTLRLAAPGGGRSGTVDVGLSLGSSSTDASCLQSWTPTKAATAAGNAAYLRGAWCGSSVDKDPSARASFGLQRTQDHTLYRRELY
jgi:MSHA biogenesis protein MshQ